MADAASVSIRGEATERVRVARLMRSTMRPIQSLGAPRLVLLLAARP